MDYKAAAELLKKQDRILILTHRRPDGDTIGCAAGLCAALREQGKTACILPNEDATSLFTPTWGLSGRGGLGTGFRGVGGYRGAEPVHAPGERYLARGIDLGIDHHPSYEGFARESCVDPGRAACGELIYDLIRQWGPVSPAAALPSTWPWPQTRAAFMYSNTTPATHRVCADLMAVGIDFQGVNKRHFRTKSLKRLRLESLLVDGMDVHDGGATVIAAISPGGYGPAGGHRARRRGHRRLPGADRGGADLRHHPGAGPRESASSRCAPIRG
ncbi:MAG: DHH family phosphoesterase [Intestinimonas sp.]